VNTLAVAALSAWPFVGGLMPLLLRIERATIVTLLFGWLFLPVAGFEIGVFDFSRVNVLSLGLLAGLVAFAPERLLAFRPSVWDLPMLWWLATASFSSIANDHGSYDAASALFYRFLGYGVPYLCGRVLLGTRRGMHELLVALFAAGLIYMPLVAYELRMSPQLHLRLYGFFQHTWDQHFRGGGYRPLVFVEHGLVLSLFLAMATLAGYALWRRGLARIWTVPTWVPVLLLAITVVMCKSMGAVLLLVVGGAMLSLGRGPWPIGVLLVAVPAFVFLRVSDSGALHWIVDLANSLWPERAASMTYRWTSEDLLLPSIEQNLWFGSPHYFGVVLDADGEFQTVVVDSLWIIALAANGLCGLVGAIGMLWVPVAGVLQLLVRSGQRAILHPAGPIGVMLALVLVDCLSNAFVAPPYLMLAGSICGLLAQRRWQPRIALAGLPVTRRRDRIFHGLAARPRIQDSTGAIE
jgi:hypothetical protein